MAVHSVRGHTFSEQDERAAVARFRQHYQSEHAADPLISIPARLEGAGSASDALDLGATFRVEKNAGGPMPFALNLGHHVPADALWSWMRRMLLTDAALCAQMTGLPELRRLSTLPDPDDAPTFIEIGEIYRTKAEIGENERSKSLLFWREFVEAIAEFGVRTVAELRAHHVTAYADDVRQKARAEDLSPTYVAHRFGKVKTILSFAKKRGVAPELVGPALDCCAVLVPPKKTSLDPHPISREAYAKLLSNTADDRVTAALLLMLNCCMYPHEAMSIQWKHLDLDAGILRMDRGKTKVARVAILWPRTIEAVRRLPKQVDVLMANKDGAPWTRWGLAEAYRDLRTRCGLPDSVKLADIRDGAYTAAVESPDVQEQHARILAGHRSGMKDHYVKRNPKMVADACAAIERAYFG